MDAMHNTPTEIREPYEVFFPAPMHEQVEFGAVTHPGKVRPTNEDSYLVYRTGRFWEPLSTSLPDDQLPTRYEANGYGMSVADGMGGHRAGEVASRLALRTAVALMLNASRWALRPENAWARQEEIEATIQRGLDYFRQINEAVASQAHGDPSLSGMGTTLTAACSFGMDLIVFHVGDSRAYLFRNGQLQQLTRDHTVAQALVEEGALPPHEAIRHPLCHVLTRAIGARGREIHADVHQVQLLDGDRVLLCSDGLTGMVPDARIAEVLAQDGPPTAACHRLLDAALEAGGKDNITVVLAHYRFPPPAPRASVPPPTVVG
jgi:protein phosphatase